MKKIIEGNIIFPSQVEYGQIIISEDLISDLIINKKSFSKPDFIIDKNKFISPGFIDIQINGGFGKEFKTDEDALEIVSNNLYKFGTTSFCPTITTTDYRRYSIHSEKLLANFSYKGQSKLIGFHYEGPMLNPEKAGAQNATILKHPNEIFFDEYVNKHTKIVTLAPELNGASEFIIKLKENKIKIGIGHSNISYENLVNIFDENNMIIVHLFNAMPPLTPRAPSIVGAALFNDNYYTSVIVDGVHLHPVTLSIIWKSKKNKNKLICITDGSAVAGLDEGTYKIGERTISKLADRAILPNGTLVGSILTLNVAVRNLIKFSNCNIVEAVNTVSLNPAKFLGIENEIGQIKIGNKADLVVLDSTYDVEKTFINGELIYYR
jgi:N-acetylglucosamine-6-phosphate deacetylase